MYGYEWRNECIFIMDCMDIYEWINECLFLGLNSWMLMEVGTIVCKACMVEQKNVGRMAFLHK